MALQVQMLSEQVQALQRELRNHPELAATVLANSHTFEDCIAHIADSVDVALHGVYNEDAVNKLCQILVNKLQDKRCVIITSISDSRMEGLK